MKVAMCYNNNDVRIEEMPVPTISDTELLVKVQASGICGSDVMEWYRLKTAPRVLGHEIAGDIVEVGKNVKKYSIGDRVFISHHVPCNNCNFCHKNQHTLYNHICHNNNLTLKINNQNLNTNGHQLYDHNFYKHHQHI